MATYTADAAQPGVQPKGLRVGLIAVTSVYSLNISTSVGMVIQMVKVPANARPVLITVANSNTGDNTVQVGDGISPARYRVEATLSSGQGMVLCGVLNNYTYSTDDTIDITISRASATTAGGALYLTAIFSMDP